MTFLPIVDRELRLASRKASTFWIRTAVAGLWFLVTGAYLAIFALTQRLGATIMTGHTIFTILSWMAFLGLALAGVFLTADTLSEEKREGTLGLLFLTDLRGYDVVFGKSAATVLQALYGLLAVIPLFAIPVLFGGVTGEDFWKTMLILVNTLFFSLAAGVFISSISVNAQRAATATLLLLAICFLVPVVVGQMSTGAMFIGLFSPMTAFMESQSNSYVFFWKSIGCSNGLAWLFLVLASILSPRTWASVPAANNSQSLGRRLRFGGAKKRAQWRGEALNTEPMLWLAGRERWQGTYFKILFFGGAAVFLIFLAIDFQAAMKLARPVTAGFTWILGFLLELWIASQACQFFIDGLRSGALELLLCTPLDSASIVRGQWKALQRMFWFPMILLVLLQVVSLVIAIKEQSPALSAIPGVDWKLYAIITSFSSIVTLLGNCIALAWFGMWMGMTTKKVTIGILKTYGLLVTVPVVAISISQSFIVLFVTLFRVAGSRNPKAFSSNIVLMMLVPALVSCVLTLIKNIVFIVISRRKLSWSFRQMAAGEIIRRSPTPSIPANLPPVQPAK